MEGDHCMGCPKRRCWRSPGEGRAGPLIIHFSGCSFPVFFVILFLPSSFLLVPLSSSLLLCLFFFKFSFPFLSFLFSLWAGDDLGDVKPLGRVARLGSPLSSSLLSSLFLSLSFFSSCALCRGAQERLLQFLCSSCSGGCAARRGALPPPAPCFRAR